MFYVAFFDATPQSTVLIVVDEARCLWRHSNN